MSDLLGGSRYLRRFLDPTAPRLNLSRKIKTPNDIQQLEQFLLSNKNITELAICELGSNEADIAVLRSVATLLQNNSTSITKLDLSGTSTDETKRFGGLGAIIIAESLERNNTLTELNLSGNLIGSEGAKAIAKALGHNVSLISVDMSSNDIGTEGIQNIGLALQKNSSLLSLNIAANPLNIDGAKLMAEISLQSNALIRFDLDKLSQSESMTIARQNVAKDQLFNYSPKKITPEVYAGYCQSVFMKETTTQFSLQEKLLRCVNSKEELVIANMFMQENARAGGLIADIGAMLLFAWFEGGFNEVRCPTSVLLYRPGHLAIKLLLQNMDRPYIALSPADFHPNNKGVDPQTLFNFAKTVHEKENLQVSMIIEDVDKMFIPYDNPKQQKNIREFIRLMAEFNSIPGSILILGTSNRDIEPAKEKKFDRIVLPKISSTLMIHYMLLLLLQNHEHNLTTNDIKILAERLSGCKRLFKGGIRKSGFMFKSDDNLAPADIEELVGDALIISKAKEANMLTMADLDLALRDSNQTIVQGPPAIIETKILTKLELETQLKLFQAKMLKEKNVFFTFDVLSLGMTAVKIDQVLHYEFMNRLKKLNLNTTSTATQIPCLNIIIVEQYWRIYLACHMSRSQFANNMNNKFVAAQSLSILRWNNMESKIMQYEQENITLKHQLDSVLKNVMRNVVNSQSGIPFEQITISKTRLGEGGFSEVWKGTWLGQHVALKKMRAGSSPFHMHVFREEAETLTRLRHKHIVMSMGITVDPNTKDVVLVMEYLKHGSLEDFVKKNGPLSAQQQAQIALDVAKGLLYIHSRTPKVIHRDIKPGNILLYDNGKRAKIADFGTARELESGANTVFGTHFYTAPEILLEHSYDETCDIYSFGVVLFEMATGSPGLPLKSETDRVKKINENVKDTKLRSLIVDCCRQDPKKRVTIGQCVEALKVMKKHLNSGS
jgi:hypothetical protein